MKNFASAGHLIGFLFATSALAPAAWAQTIPEVAPPPDRYVIDENGVNVATGYMIQRVQDISIGNPEQRSGLALLRDIRFRISDFDGGHNYDSGVYVSGTNVTASVGTRSYKFTLSGTTYTPSDGKGAQLSHPASGYTLITEDGTTVTYNYTTRDSSDVNRVARASTMTYPSGEKVQFYWTSTVYCTRNPDVCFPGSRGIAVRLQAVTSIGYQLHFFYDGDGTNIDTVDVASWRKIDSAKTINTTIDACDPNAVICTLAHTWPTVTYDFTNGVTDPVGNKTLYTTAGSQTTIRRPSSATDNFVANFDLNGRATTIVRDGMTWTYAFSLSGTVMSLTRTDPLGHQRAYVSNTSIGLPTSVTDELGHVISYVYDTTGRITKATAPEGNNVNYTYDARGNLTQTKVVAKTGSGVADIITSAVFPASCTNTATCNKPTSTTDAKGNVTDYTYDAVSGAVATITRPAAPNGIRPQTRLAYGSITTVDGALTKPISVSECQTLASCTGAADEVKVTIGYDNQARVNSIAKGAGNGSLTATNALTYSFLGDPLTVDGPLAGTADTTTFRYDDDRRRTGIISPDPDGAGAMKRRAVKTVYNIDGNVATVQRGTVNGTTDTDWAALAVLETQTAGYDAAARIATIGIAGTNGLTQALTQRSYDGESRFECEATRMNPAVFATLPASACSLGTPGSNGPDRITKLIYDAADEVTQRRVAFGTADEAADATLTYSVNGKLATLTDGEVNKTTYLYDGDDRLLTTQYPLPTKGANASSTTDYEQNGFDPNSNVTSRRRRDGQSIAFTYDALDRPSLKNLPGTELDISYVYDNLGRLTSATQTGTSLTFTYDALSRNLNEVGPLGTTSSTYDLADRRTRLTYPGTGLFVDSDYLVTGEQLNLRENSATSGVGVLATFAYDDLGRRTGLTRGNGTVTTYGYDSVSRLASQIDNLTGTTNDQTLTFAYNSASQIASQTKSNDLFAWTGHGSGTTAITANGLNQLTAIGGAAPTYDARGNLTSDPTSGRTYAYSSENLLTSASGGATLAYDPLLRLRQVAAASTTRFGYDGLAMIAEADASNAIQRRYVFGPADDEPLVQYEGAGITDRRWLHADERGSVVAISDAGGNAITINRYDEYGKPQATNAGRFQYTGQAWLPEIGAYYYKARVYVPQLGRFLQTDPIGVGRGINLYAYVGNDPVNWVDPLGFVPCNLFTGVHCDEFTVTGTRRDAGRQNGIVGSNVGRVRERTRQKTPLARQSCVINKLAKVGDQMQNYGLLFGLGGAVATAVAPEAMVGEAAVGSGLALYGAGSALKDSVSISNFVFNSGNATGFALGRLNNFLLNNVPEGPSRNVVERVLDRAEHEAGLDKGDEGGC